MSDGTKDRKGVPVRLDKVSFSYGEAPLTFEELSKIKNSFQFTLLNMLHARIAYPTGESSDTSEAKA